MLLSLAVFGGQPAWIGSAFADVYGAFAPLGVLHRSYADFLFYGTDMVIPGGLAGACAETGYLLGLLHVSLLDQTASRVVDTMPRMARLRADLATFCDVHSDALLDISLMDEPDPVILEGASDLGLFSGTYRLQQGLRFVFEETLESFADERSTWEFAVAFALKTMLDQDEPGRLEASLQDILYGSEGATLPPSFLPQDIAVTITQLVEFIDVPLDAGVVDEIRVLVQLIYDYVIGGS